MQICFRWNKVGWELWFSVQLCLYHFYFDKIQFARVPLIFRPDRLTRSSAKPTQSNHPIPDLGQVELGFNQFHHDCCLFMYWFNSSWFDFAQTQVGWHDSIFFRTSKNNWNPYIILKFVVVIKLKYTQIDFFRKILIWFFHIFSIVYLLWMYILV